VKLNFTSALIEKNSLNQVLQSPISAECLQFGNQVEMLTNLRTNSGKREDFSSFPDVITEV
jgi:hypothetical protein